MRCEQSLMLTRALGVSLSLAAMVALGACSSSSTSVKDVTTNPTGASTAGSTSGTSAVVPSGGTPTSSGATPTTKPKSAGPIVACNLVTKAEAEAALGVAVDPGVLSEDSSSCEYFPVDPLSAGSITGVVIQIEDVEGFNQAKGSGPVLHAVITPVIGLGDDAFLLAIPNADGSTSILGTQLHVLKGSTGVVVSVRKKGSTDADMAALEKSLAAVILPRLP